MHIQQAFPCFQFQKIPIDKADGVVSFLEGGNNSKVRIYFIHIYYYPVLFFSVGLPMANKFNACTRKTLQEIPKLEQRKTLSEGVMFLLHMCT